MTLSRSIRTVFLAGAMLIFSAQAQTLSTGELTGTVTDPSGAFVAAAKVDLTSQASGQQTSVASSSIGEFRFSLLPPGPYTLTVTAPRIRALNTADDGRTGAIVESIDSTWGTSG